MLCGLVFIASARRERANPNVQCLQLDCTWASESRRIEWSKSLFWSWVTIWISSVFYDCMTSLSLGYYPSCDVTVAAGAAVSLGAQGSVSTPDDRQQTLIYPCVKIMNITGFDAEKFKIIKGEYTPLACYGELRINYCITRDIPFLSNSLITNWSQTQVNLDRKL
ncbi:unnamed protein product [Trichobilharzia regenti]|nr:unnamed protein product [Trichobilharzia regenti]